ncbi:MAG: pantoate--beta-alanine ligase [Saprospiraceae bacterium]|nr:pantoate--beta-alanine ligase [Saprospiraceae bacterium]
MLLFKEVKSLQKYLIGKNGSVGFVPTMGALHAGHMSIVRHARTENDISVCSIFVNPTQFNESSDLDAYPRLPGQDIAKLSEEGNDILFMPSVHEIYPTELPEPKAVDLNGLDQGMEGAFRPGHFAGVAQVVGRLLDIVNPHRLYMGQKDYQQVAVIDHVIRETGRSVELRVHPTIRETDGLAMSSRNLRLNLDERNQAIRIYQTLQEIQVGFSAEMPISQLEDEALKALDRPGFKPEYVAIVDRKTLLPFRYQQNENGAVACVACWVGGVRLIDNILLEPLRLA